MDLELKNKVALVTRSTAGIGFSIAERLASEGARVIVHGKTSECVATAIAKLHKINPDFKLEAAAGDLSLATDADEIFARFPEVDILVNNLAIFESKEFVKISDEDWRRFFDVNVMSGIRLSQAYLPVMLRQNQGRIIFISSELALQVPAEIIHYEMTKAAQIAVSRSMAELTTGTNVTVNCVLRTPTHSEVVDEFKNSVASEKSDLDRPKSSIRRFATCDEIANLVCFVSSPLSSAINGTLCRVDGGANKSAY